MKAVKWWQLTLGIAAALVAIFFGRRYVFVNDGPPAHRDVQAFCKMGAFAVENVVAAVKRAGEGAGKIAGGIVDVACEPLVASLEQNPAEKVSFALQTDGEETIDLKVAGTELLRPPPSELPDQPRADECAAWESQVLFDVCVSGALAAPDTTAGGLSARRSLVFVSRVSGTSQIYEGIVPSETACNVAEPLTEVQALTTGMFPAQDPAVSINLDLAFEGEDDPANIYVQQPGQASVRITTSSLHEEDPAWSPDGEWIAFTRGSPPDIYLMRVDGSEERRLTDDPAADEDPAWSPDGSHIAFVRADARGGYLFIMDRHGGNQHAVTHDLATVLHPTWAPAGGEIAFASDRDGGDLEIYRVNPDGAATPTPLTDNSGVDDRGPSWSPDGDLIAFVRSPGAGNQRIWIMVAADPTCQAPLSSGFSDDYDPSWQPAGS